MAYVYRYLDLTDNIIKYVGIVWGVTRKLGDRIREEELNCDWIKSSKWKVEYIEDDINTRTDAEYFEAHYISLYKTGNYYNKSKSNWGQSSFLPERNDWKEFKIINCKLNKNKEDDIVAKHTKYSFFDYNCINKVIEEYINKNEIKPYLFMSESTKDIIDQCDDDVLKGYDTIYYDDDLPLGTIEIR